MEHFEKALEKARGRKVDAEKAISAPSVTEKVLYSAPTHTPTTTLQRTPESSELLALKFADPLADLFRMLRTQVLKGLAKKKATMLGICSARAGEGKTFVASNLAASIALSQEHTVLLVDLDLRRPAVHKQFSIPGSPGITNILGGSVKLTECVRDTSLPGLQLLPAGAPIRNSSEALGSSELAKIINELRQSAPSRILICDLPPLLASDDALLFSSKVDAVLFVVEEGKTRPGELQRSLELLDPVLVLGTVLNKSQYNNPYPYSHYEISSA